jgi:hypothetical protein
MSSDQFVVFLQSALKLCARHTIDGGITYACMDWRHVGELLQAGSAVYDELKNICVWAKTTPGQGSFYRSQHELVFVYKRGQAPHLNTFELGQHGRTRSNVWTYAGANTFRPGRMDELKMHPTVKPVALIADSMKDCSRRGSVILDAFAGSGTTIIAAEQVGRRAYRLQADRCGDLDAREKRLLDCAVTPEDAGQRAVDNTQPTADVRPGTVLDREWKGRMHRVAVLSDGFAWNGKTYPSLSKTAHAITGTRWNGPRFFGLRERARYKPATNPQP